MNKEEVMALFVDDIELRKQAIVQFIQDSSNSYEDRLEVWRKTPEHLYTIEPYVIHLDEFDSKYEEISWFDDFYVARYEICDLTDAVYLQSDWDEDRVKDFNIACMNLGIHAFRMDW